MEGIGSLFLLMNTGSLEEWRGLYFNQSFSQYPNKAKQPQFLPLRILPDMSQIIDIFMGTSSSIANFEVSQPLGSEWVKESRESYCAVLRNIESGEQAEQYVVASNGSIFNEFERYEYRLQQNVHLVSTWAVQHLGDDGVCNGPHLLLVTNERIPLRLSEIKGLSFQDALTVIASALVGFQAIHAVEGYVAVSDQMIGFTPAHWVKVWLNENFSQNHPALPFRMVNHQYSASTMIQEIIAAVEVHSAQAFPADFKVFFNARFAPTSNFQTALIIVRDYAQLNAIPLTGRVTFTGETPVVEEITSFVYPPAPAQHVNYAEYVDTGASSFRRSTMVHEAPPTVTFVQDQGMSTIVRDTVQVPPYHIIQEAPIAFTPAHTILPVASSANFNPVPVKTIPSRVVNNTHLAHSVFTEAPQTTFNHFGRSHISPSDPAVRRSAVLPRQIQSPLAQSHIVRPITSVTDRINIAPVSMPLPLSVAQILPARNPTPPRQELPTRLPVPVQPKPLTGGNIQRPKVQPQTINNRAQTHSVTNLQKAENFLQSLGNNPISQPVNTPPQITRISPNPTRNASPNKKPILQNLFEKRQDVKEVQVFTSPAAGVKTTKVQPVAPSNPITQRVIKNTTVSSTPITKVAPNARGPAFVTPQIPRTQIRTVNIDGVTTTGRLEQSDIFTYHDVPKAPINILPTGTQNVGEGLKNVIREIDRDISISSSHPRGELSLAHASGIDPKAGGEVGRKEDDLIEYMRVNLRPQANAEQKLESSKMDVVQGSEGLLSQEVKDLLKNYESKREYNDYTHQYKYSGYQVEDPLVAYKSDPFENIETRYAYDQPSDDYETLKAKYQNNNERKDISALLDINYAPKNYNYKSTFKQESYGDYSSVEKRNGGDDPLIIFNTKKPDVVSRPKNNDYEPRSQNYTSNYDDYKVSSRDNYANLNQDNNELYNQDKYSGRENKYASNKYDRVQKYEKSAGNRYEKRGRKESGVTGDEGRSRGNLSYHDLRSLLYD